MKTLLIVIPYMILVSCERKDVARQHAINDTIRDTIRNIVAETTSTSRVKITDTIPHILETKGITADSIITFAKTLLRTPYKYASSDPAVGFDCSGFITYVFNHFNIQVPRSSRDFEHSGTTIPLPQVKKGDLILFTGTDSTETFIGHIGIVISNVNDSIEFIHSSSGKANGVVITGLNKYYMSRYIKTVRLLP